LAYSRAYGDCSASLVTCAVYMSIIDVCSIVDVFFFFFFFLLLRVAKGGLGDICKVASVVRDRLPTTQSIRLRL
jgi:hypothetical protein